jgi:predicted  nucleic acid-binding Zn-ribbon protein
VDESFARLIRANATITAHLNSIRTVQEVQDEALRSLKLADLRDEINKRLVEASEKAEFALTKVEGVTTKVDELSTKKKELLEKRKGGSN